jgi:hypothetical protein
VDPAAESLLRRFVDALGGEVQVAVRRGSGRSERWETSTGIPMTVTRSDPGRGVVEVDLRSGGQLRLHLPEGALLDLLDGAGASGSEAWGQPLSDEEAATRFLTIHLDESVATREAHPSGWWEYEAGSFVPLPPWEAAARRRRRH